MVGASGAHIKAATSQRSQPQGFAIGMVEASCALMKAAASQHREAQRIVTSKSWPPHLQNAGHVHVVINLAE